MRINPAEAPLYGKCVLTVELDDNEACPSDQGEEEEDTAEFYLLFSGSTQRHLTSTIQVSHVTLQAVCPGHNVCEQVLVVLCVVRPNGSVITCSQENFTFVQDLALDTAHLLLDSTSHQESLLLRDQKECEKLDRSLSLALKHLSLLHRQSPLSDMQPHLHSLREALCGNQARIDNHTNITQDQTHSATEAHSTEMDQCTVSSSKQCNSVTEHQQHSGLLHLAATDSLSTTGSYILQQPGGSDTPRSTGNQQPSTACGAKTKAHQQLLELFTHSEAGFDVKGDSNDELHVDPDGRVFQHHSKLGTFTLTLPSHEQWENKPSADRCLRDDVAQLRKCVQQHREKKGKLEHCGTIIETTAPSTYSCKPVNPAFSKNTENGSTKPAQESLSQCDGLLENTAVGSVCPSQETGERQTARIGRNKKNKKRTCKTARAVTECSGSTPVAAEGTAWLTVAETTVLSSTEQPTATAFTENRSKKELSLNPTGPGRDEQCSSSSSSSSRKTVALPASAIVEKQEEEKREVERIILDQVTQTVKEWGHTKILPTKECLVISHQEADTESKENMGQDQSQNSEKAASPDAEIGSHHKSNEMERKPQKVPDGSKIVSSPQGAEIATVQYQGDNNDLMREETKSQSVWYDSEQLEQGKSKEKDLSSPQLFEQCVSSCQLSPTLSQPHAAGIKPAVSHGTASQRQEVHGSQRDEEAGPDWKKAGREEVSIHSKKSSENEEEDERQGHGEKGAKCRKKKRKKRGKRGGTEHKKLSSSSSIESQSHIEIQMQVTDQNILASRHTDITGRADIPAPSSSAPGKTDEDTMHLPNQAETKGETRDGTNLNFGTLDSGLTELSGASDLNLLGELSEVKNTTFHQSTELTRDIAAAQSEEMDLRTTENVVTPESLTEKREIFDGKDNIVSVNEDRIGEASEDQPDGGSNSSAVLPVTHPDRKKFSADLCFEQERVLVQSIDKPLQLGYPSGSSPETAEPVGAYGSPIDGTTDVPPLQTREGSTEITAEGQLGHCLASEMLGRQALEEENKDELWKEEEDEIGSLQRCEKTEPCSNHSVAETEEGPFKDNELENNMELAATAVAVVTVAIASAMARLEISQQLAESCTKRPAINLSTQRKTDEMPAPFNLVSDSVSTSPLTQDINKGQPHCDSPTETEKPPSHTELNIAFQQESFTDSNAIGNPPDANSQTQTDHDLLAEQDNVCLLQAESQTDSHKQDLAKLSSNEQNELKSSAQKDKTSLFQNECTGLQSSDTNLPSPKLNEVLGKIPNPCPVLDTGQKGPHMFDPKNKLRLKESTKEEGRDTHILVEGCPLNDKGEVGDLTEERGTSPKESCKTSLTNIMKSENVLLTIEEQALPPSCDPVSPITPQESSLRPEENIFVEFDTGIQSCQQLSPDAEAAVVMEIKDEALECLDGDSDNMDGWKEKERLKNEGKEQAKTSQLGTDTFSENEEREDSVSKSSVVDCLHALQIQRETDVFCPVQHCPEPSAQTCTDIHADSKKCPSVCLLQEDSKRTNSEVEDNVFKESEDSAPCTEDRDHRVRVSWSSTDDTSSVLGTLSEEPSITMSDHTSRLSWKSEAEDTGLGEMEGGEEEEKKDQLPANLVTSAILRASQRSLSPLRRHSWEPGRNSAPADTDVAQCSSLKSLSEEMRAAKTPLHRRSMSWCPSNICQPDPEQIDNRSYSLEGLEEQVAGQMPCPGLSEQGQRDAGRGVCQTGQDKGSLVSLTEEEQETCHQVLSMTSSYPAMFPHQILTKSISMVAISHRDIDACGYPRSKRRISFSISFSPLLSKNRHFFSVGSSSSDEEEVGGSSSSFSCNSGSVEHSISEEEPGPLRSSTEAKGGPKISRTFSYLRSKMSKKGKEKEKDRRGEKERESKERDKKTSNGHMFTPVHPPASTSCQHCSKLLQNKESLHCSHCGVHVHKGCKESVAVCAKSKNKLQVMAPEAATPAVNTRTKSTSSTGSTVSTLSSSSRERWSTATTPEDQFPLVHPRRPPSIFTTQSNLSKSISTSNIAGLDDVALKALKFRSQSTDSLNQSSKVNASTESLTDEGTEMMDSQLMGEFECDMKDLEADSWSSTVDKKFLKTLKKDEIKRQDVIYELYQTEFHHVRTLRIMSEVYYKGIQKELQLDSHTLDKIFPVLDDLLETHTEFLNQLLEQKKASSVAGQNSSFLICRIGDTLVQQFSGSSAERMKKVYGKFCSRHNEAVNVYKDLQAKDKRFQTFIKKVMSSSIVRRLSIPECILLVTQRITKYPVLIQRILQHTKDTDTEQTCVSEALRLVKEILTAVDSKVNEQEKKRRLKEVYSRTDSKSIMRMKSGQMFAKEDLIRGRRLLHDGALQLKNSAGRLKEVHALLLSDVLVFLQEKDQKYVFASLDQRSTVISLQNLIVREVANEERGLFLITAGTEKPEMVEVLASSKDERNTWRAIIQDAMHCMEKDEDEGIPSETEEDRRQQESRAKEIRELLRSKDEQIVSLLEEKVHIFRELSDCSAALYDAYPAVRERMLFRATPDNVTKGEPIIQEALREVETLHSLVNTGLGGAGCSVSISPSGGGVGPVCLPRRAETFGGFDSHQMNSSKNGEKEEADESVDLRRTESDGVLKKGATASLQMLLKRNNEQVHSSVTNLHDLLLSLQAVVVQQDSFIEDQRQAMNERLAASSSRHSSSSSLSSTSSSRPSSLIEQEKHRSLERQRQEAASLQKQQAAHQEEKRRREKEWEAKDRALCEREEKLKEDEERAERRRQELQEERELLHRNKDQYQRELERLREAQTRLERDKEALKRDTERLEAQRREQMEQLQRYNRTPSITSEDSMRFPSTTSLDLDCRDAAEQPKEVELSSSAPTKEPFLRIGSKRMGKNFNPFSSSSSKAQGAEKEPSRLLQLTKSKKDKKDKKKKKGAAPPTENPAAVMSDPQNDGDIFFC